MSELINKKANESFPRFTVIIPQKNRAEYLYHTIRTCMIQDYPNFEILVSDDCSEDNSVEVVNRLISMDKRIKLFTHEHHLGMKDNFEFVLNKVQPGYVIALGGDDGLVPGAIWRMYEILQKTQTQLLTWKQDVFCFPEPSDVHNILCVNRWKKRFVKVIDSRDYLNKIAKSFFYMTDDCPMFYVKGVASTDLVDRVKARTPDHCFYSCPTPDGYSGVVLAGEAGKYSFTNEPLSITGSSPKSQGKNYKRSDPKSVKEAEEFFNDTMAVHMHKELASQPYSPLITLMTADYLLTARDLPGWPGSFCEISYEQLIRKTFRFIENANYNESRLVRELRILRKIADQHHLSNLFDTLYAQTKLKTKKGKDVVGFAITHSIRIDGSEVGINNIFDAACASHYISNIYHKVSFAGGIEALSNSLKIVLQKSRYKKQALPKID